jgi:glycosyltransferase involved in cell wall biosynthesis
LWKKSWKRNVSPPHAAALDGEQMRRKVLHIVEASDAGVGRHVLDLVGGLVDAGWDVHLVYSPLRMGEAFRHALKSMSGVTAVQIPMKRSVHPADAVSVWKVVKYLKKAGPFDLVHGHSSKGGALARIAARIAGLPSFYTPNALVTMNPELGRWKARTYRFVERALGRIGTVLVAVSHDEREHALSLGIAPEKVVVIPNGIALENLPQRDAVRASLGIDLDATVIGFVGRLFAQKAPEVLLRAFAQSTGPGTNAVLAVVGDGPLRSQLESLAETLGVSGKIRWLGTRPGQQSMPAFDLFAMPSHYEGMPYVLLEAAHAGLPIVATRVSGVSLVVRNGENGFTVAPGDVEAMTKALDALLSNAELRREFSQASRARVKEWSIQRMIDDTIRLYTQFLPTCDEHLPCPQNFRELSNFSSSPT